MSSAKSRAGGRRWLKRDALIDLLMGAVGAIVMLAIASVPLSARDQMIFATCTMVIFLVCNRFKSRTVTMFLVVLSLAVSLRYIFGA